MSWEGTSKHGLDGTTYLESDLAIELLDNLTQIATTLTRTTQELVKRAKGLSLGRMGLDEPVQPQQDKALCEKGVREELSESSQEAAEPAEEPCPAGSLAIVKTAGSNPLPTSQESGTPPQKELEARLDLDQTNPFQTGEAVLRLSKGEPLQEDGGFGF